MPWRGAQALRRLDMRLEEMPVWGELRTKACERHTVDPIVHDPGAEGLPGVDNLTCPSQERFVATPFRCLCHAWGPSSTPRYLALPCTAHPARAGQESTMQRSTSRSEKHHKSTRTHLRALSANPLAAAQRPKSFCMQTRVMTLKLGGVPTRARNACMRCSTECVRLPSFNHARAEVPSGPGPQG